MSEIKQKQQQLDIEIDDTVADGIYSNLAIINHSHSEFILDFVNMMPGKPKAKVKSRVILTPQHIKRLLRALAENVQRFEKTYGQIKESEQPQQIHSFGPAGQA